MTPALRRRRDAIAVSVALGLLLLAALGWWRVEDRAQAQRAQVLAGLPPFPSEATPWRRAAPPAGLPSAAPAAVPQEDRLAAFALAPWDHVAVVQVNALLNTPLYAKLEACIPMLGVELGDAGSALGIDLRHEVDRVAIVPGGVAFSGAFSGRPVAQRLAGPNATSSSHRGVTILQSPGLGGDCVAQLDTVVLLGAAGQCEALVDRALSSPGDPSEATALESDLYLRTDLSLLRPPAGAASSTERPELSQLLDALGSMRLRANVWDEVALTLDGTPREGQPGGLEALRAAASLALDAARAQAGNAPRWSALLDRAGVRIADGRLEVELALPAEALLHRLELCPRDGGSPGDEPRESTGEARSAGLGAAAGTPSRPPP